MSEGRCLYGVPVPLCNNAGGPRGFCDDHKDGEQPARLVVATRGLPASGKSTWAREMQSRSRGEIVLLSKDDLRNAFHGGQYSPTNERQIERMWEAVLIDCVNEERWIIVHDTNLNPAFIDWMAHLCAEKDAVFHVVDFTSIPVDVCVRRDERRSVGKVGEKVIRGMAARWGLS